MGGRTDADRGGGDGGGCGCGRGTVRRVVEFKGLRRGQQNEGQKRPITLHDRQETQHNRQPQLEDAIKADARLRLNGLTSRAEHSEACKAQLGQLRGGTYPNRGGSSHHAQATRDGPFTQEVLHYTATGTLRRV